MPCVRTRGFLLIHVLNLSAPSVSLLLIFSRYLLFKIYIPVWKKQIFFFGFALFCFNVDSDKKTTLWKWDQNLISCVSNANINWVKKNQWLSFYLAVSHFRFSFDVQNVWYVLSISTSFPCSHKISFFFLPFNIYSVRAKNDKKKIQGKKIDLSSISLILFKVLLSQLPLLIILHNFHLAFCFSSNGFHTFYCPWNTIFLPDVSYRLLLHKHNPFVLKSSKCLTVNTGSTLFTVVAFCHYVA